MGDCFDWKQAEEEDEKCSKCLELNLYFQWQTQLVIAVDLSGKALFFTP